MGLFDRFRKKDTAIVHDKLTHFKGAVLQSFSHIRRDIDVQKQWIAYLGNIHEVLKGAHESHRELSGKEMQNIRDWIRHLDQSTKKHSETMHSLEKSLKDAFNQYNNHILELYRRIDSMNKNDMAIREQIKKDVENIIAEQHKETARQISHSQKTVEDVRKKHQQLEDSHKSHIDEIQNIKKEHTQTKDKLTSVLDNQQKAEKALEKRFEGISEQTEFTKPEQKLLNLLLAEPDPLSYQLIAEKTGNSINTVRVIMNNLKKRGLIEEHVLPSGVKLFNANNKEKIKKLYNIEHL